MVARLITSSKTIVTINNTSTLCDSTIFVYKQKTSKLGKTKINGEILINRYNLFNYKSPFTVEYEVVE